MMKRKAKTHRNPFKAYQERRMKENAAKIKGAIETLKKAKAPISVSAVARFAGLTVSGISRNSKYVMMIETAKAHTSHHIKDSPEPTLEDPRTLDDALAIIRILRAKVRDVRNKLNIQAKVFKRYNIDFQNGEYTVVPTAQAVDRMERDTVDALIRIVWSIINDKVYEVTSKGIINSFGEVVVPMALIEAAGIKNEFGKYGNAQMPLKKVSNKGDL